MDVKEQFKLEREAEKNGLVFERQKVEKVIVLKETKKVNKE